jgi:hypothetical protein
VQQDAEIQVKGDEMVRTCSMHGEKRNAYPILVGKPEGKTPLEDLNVRGRMILIWVFER